MARQVSYTSLRDGAAAVIGDVVCATMITVDKKDAARLPSTDVEFRQEGRHSGGMNTEKRRPPPGARQLNKLAAKLAGRRILPLWALVRHRGRKSGKPYETPIAIVGSNADSVYIALPWGRGTDWVRNLQAADGGTLVWKGRMIAVSEPAFVTKDEALAAAPEVRRRVAGRWTMEDFLRLRLLTPS